MLRWKSCVACVAVCVGMLVTGFAIAAKPPVPDESKGFSGTISGAVVEKAAQSNWISVKVTKATPDGKSKLKNASAMVGKDVPVSCRLAGATPNPEQQAYFTALNVGDSVELSIFYNDNAGNVAIRLRDLPAAATAVTAKKLATSITFPSQVKLGNIFTAGEKPAIEAASGNFATVEWSIRDFRGKAVASGTATAEKGKVTIAPEVTAKGYYTVELNGRAADGATTQATTAFAIVPAFDTTKMQDSPFGVNTHFAQGMPTAILPLLAKCGIAHIRDMIAWQQVEKEAGTFNFEKPSMKYMGLLKKQGITNLPVLAFGNTNYFSQGDIQAYQAAPYDKAGYDAYARYCKAMVDHFPDQFPAVEIWNEYNGTFCKGPAEKDRPKFYTEMLKTSYQAIKASHPNTEVIGVAAVPIPMAYIRGVFENGGLQFMDAVAVHPYQPTPEGVEIKMGKLVELMKQYNNGKAKAIWPTEVGSWWDKNPERSAQASYLARMLTLLMTIPETERVHWYLACDHPGFEGMGLLRPEDDPMGKFVPGMMYPAYAALIDSLYGTKIQAAEPTSDLRTRVYRFGNKEKTVYVCWSTFGDSEMTFDATGPLRVVNMVGGETQVSPEGGKVRVAMPENCPVYVTAQNNAVTAVHESPRSDKVVADSARDFGDKQNGSGWSYSWIANNATGTAAYNPAAVNAMELEPAFGDQPDKWKGPIQFMNIVEGGSQPGVQGGNQLWTVRRWTSTVAGEARIVVTYRLANKGDGVGCKVFLDGKEVGNKMVEPKDTGAVEVKVTLAQGSKVDVVVTPGKGTDSTSDNLGCRATILMPQ